MTDPQTKSPKLTRSMAEALLGAKPLCEEFPLSIHWRIAGSTIRGLRARGLIRKHPSKVLTPLGLSVRTHLEKGMKT